VSIREPSVPDAGKIAAVVVPLLGWEDAGHLLNTFCGKVWPGVVTSELLQDLSTWRPINQDVSGGHSNHVQMTDEVIQQGRTGRSCDSPLLPPLYAQATVKEQSLTAARTINL
jgi:hypothetical protein